MGWTPLAAVVCQSGGVEHHSREASMGEVTTVGLDLAKMWALLARGEVYRAPTAAA